MILANKLKPSMQILPVLNSTSPHHQPALHCMRQQSTPFLQLGLLQQPFPHLYNLWWLLYQLREVSSQPSLHHHSRYHFNTTHYKNTRQHSQGNIPTSHQHLLHTSHLYLFRYLSKARFQPQHHHHHVQTSALKNMMGKPPPSNFGPNSWHSFPLWMCPWMLPILISPFI